MTRIGVLKAARRRLKLKPGDWKVVAFRAAGSCCIQVQRRRGNSSREIAASWTAHTWTNVLTRVPREEAA